MVGKNGKIRFFTLFVSTFVSHPRLKPWAGTFLTIEDYLVNDCMARDRRSTVSIEPTASAVDA